MIVHANSIVQHVIQTKNRIMIYVNASVKSIVRAKKIIVGIVALIPCICENSRYLKSIVDNPVIEFDEIIHITDSV